MRAWVAVVWVAVGLGGWRLGMAGWLAGVVLACWLAAGIKSATDPMAM
jgi:hypothetical protein